MNASYLGAYVINNMDLKISNYFKYIADMQTKIPAFNRTSIIGNEIKEISNSEEESSLLKDYYHIQYNALFDYAR